MAGTAEIEDVSDNAGKVIDLNDDVDELDRDRTEEEDDPSEDAGEDEDASADESDDEAEDESKDEAEEKDDAEESSDDTSDDAADADEKDDGDDAKAEIASLRQMVRAQRLQMKDLEVQMKKQNDALVEGDLLTDDSATDEEKAATEQRSEMLDQMVELMELTPKLEDVKYVCSQSNFNDVTDMLAKAYVAEHGGDADDVAGEIASTVWAKPNPYKEMYKLVKDYHPDFAKKKSESKSEDVLEKAKKGKEKAAPSLSNMPSGGGKSGGSGWTSQRIDQLTEDELTKVPSDVYDKYMLGELD